MRVWGVVLLLAVAWLTMSSLVWLRLATSSSPSETPDPTEVLKRFTANNIPQVEIDLLKAYGGRTELLDPHQALPTWHKHNRVEAARVYAAMLQCPPLAVEPISDVALAK